MSDLLADLGILPIINATGTLTRHGGSRVVSHVAEAMMEAVGAEYDMAELQGRASSIIAAHTGAEAGIVTSGAAAGLLLGTAACLAGLDPVKMGRLPDTTGLRNEFVVPHSHRNSYDHSVRAAGAQLIEVGVADRWVGVGVRDTEAWEIEGAITPRTAGVLYVAQPHARPSLASVVAIAHRANLPVLVDAAAQLPPASNLRRFLDEGADLVVFSGGKAIGGPSASGILCGRRQLVASALLQQLDLDYALADWQPPANIIDAVHAHIIPRHGIGRSSKVGKEQIVGLLLALCDFAAAGDGARHTQWQSVANALMTELSPLHSLQARIVPDTDGRGVPLIEVQIDTATVGLTAQAVADQLRSGRPSVRVDTSKAHHGILLLVPTCLQERDARVIREALERTIGRA